MPHPGEVTDAGFTSDGRIATLTRNGFLRIWEGRTGRALTPSLPLEQKGLALAMRRVVPYVDRASGALLLLAGAYVVYYWTFFLLPGADSRTSGRSVIDRGGLASSRIATWLSSSNGKAAVAVLLGGIVALVVWALWRRLFGGATSGPAAMEAVSAQVRESSNSDEGSPHEQAPSKP